MVGIYVEKSAVHRGDWTRRFYLSKEEISKFYP
jgi:hypothetical protein